MKINTRSWHYKFIKFVGEMWDSGRFYGMPKTLCSYFWTLVLFTPLKVITLSLIAVTAFTMIVVFPLSLIPNIWFDILGEDEIIFSLIIFTLEMGLLGFILISMYQNSLPHEVQCLRQRPPSVFGSYLKAKKNKFCPIIEFI